MKFFFSLTRKIRIAVSLTFLFAITVSAIAAPLHNKALAQNISGIAFQTSADDFGGTFFGEGVLQVVVTDPSAENDAAREEITVTIDADPETGAAGSDTFIVPETSASSRTFEFFLVQQDANAVSNAELDPINAAGVQDYDGSGNEAPIIRFGATGDLVIESSLFEETSFEITVGNSEISVDYDEMDAILELDREIYGTDSIMYVRIIDNDANLNPTAADSFTVVETDLTNSASDLFTILGGTFVDDVTFTETGDNTAVFEATIQLTEADSGTDDEFDFSAELVEMTLYDKAEYRDISGGNNFSTSTSSVSFGIDDVDGEFDEIGIVTFASELKLTLRDADRNIDSEIDDTIDDAVVVSVDSLGGDTELLEMKEMHTNSGTFAIYLSNNELRITFLAIGENPTINNGVLELREEDIIKDIVVEYTDPKNDESAVSVTSLLTFKMTLQNGTVNLPDAISSNNKFMLTISDFDLNNNPRVRDSYTVTLQGMGPYPISRGGLSLENVALLDMTIDEMDLNFTNSMTETLVETGIGTGQFETELELEDILASAGLSTEDLKKNSVLTIEYKDLLVEDEGGIHISSDSMRLSESPSSPPPAIDDPGFQDIIETIDEMDLERSTSASLKAPLEQALMLLRDENPENDDNMYLKLNAFENKVVRFEEIDKLNSEQARLLYSMAVAIEGTYLT